MVKLIDYFCFFGARNNTKQEFLSGSVDLKTISFIKSLHNFFSKDLVNGHSIKVCSMESLSPQFRHSSSVLMPNMNSSFLVITNPYL